MTMELFLRALTARQREFFLAYLGQREASLQRALAEPSTVLGRISREHQQLIGDRHARS